MQKVDRAREADRDTLFTRFVRSARHPLRVVTMGIATFCLVADVAMGTGITAAVLGAMAGVLAGELLARTPLRLSWVLGGLAAVAGIGLAIGGTIVRVEGIVAALGTGLSLHLTSFVSYGSVAFFATAAMRATAKRHPSWIALELAFLVLSVAAALAAHRGGIVVRPLWLSDFAWRRGIDPADVILAIGVGSALVAISLLLFERKGRLSLAALPLVPLVAMLAVSCFEITREQAELGESSPDSIDSDQQGNDTGEEGDDQGGTSSGLDGGVPRDGGGSGDAGRVDGGGGGSSDGGLDGGAGGRADASIDGGASGGGGDASIDGGASSGGGGDASISDGGGGAGAGGDASTSGGGGGSQRDGGGGGQPSAWDAGVGDHELPPPRETGDQGEQGGPVDPSDLQDRPPPSGGGGSSPVAVVLFERDYSPPSGNYYFRQEAWTELEGARLVPTTRDGADGDLARAMPTSRAPVSAPPPELGRDRVPATVALLINHPLPFALESPVWFAEARNPNPGQFRRAYRFFSLAQTIGYQDLLGRGTGDPAWPAEVRALYLTTHPDPRFQQFADETIASMPEARRDDPFARAVAIKLRLDGMLTYSTRERHADAADPVVDFFFGNRIGYCVHFAHAAVFLFRAAGVPSRIGIGYMSEEANRRGGSSLVIQAGDAHAWPEVYVEGVGWIVLDIAAHENLDPPRPPQDEELQQRLGEMAREQPPDPEDEIEPQQTRRQQGSLATAMWILFALALALVLAALYTIKLWRRVAPTFASNRTRPRLAYRAALDRLAEVGLVREHGETREQFAARAARLAPAFERATALLLASRLGHPGAPPSDASAWRDATASMKRELRTSTKTWRRLLGLAHPLSFLDSR
ncbi:transglutaminase-like domain-containing protein [Sandaracinus amylolyticus]|uniref:transglutaminase-like domain-containing protein n=1 Tax=Sandaracinus amylolyticus TaxID=927083 RepID=UPI001F4435E1|nr:transglutaminase-like domain-containing protein [Sandaracinus amylolyticus]UJR84440.1 Hypothetical protein I5071_65190 [Sandaracinus amylolyticus]